MKARRAEPAGERLKFLVEHCKTQKQASSAAAAIENELATLEAEGYDRAAIERALSVGMERYKAHVREQRLNMTTRERKDALEIERDAVTNVIERAASRYGGHSPQVANLNRFRDDINRDLDGLFDQAQFVLDAPGDGYDLYWPKTRRSKRGRPTEHRSETRALLEKAIPVKAGITKLARDEELARHERITELLDKLFPFDRNRPVKLK